MDGVLKRCIVAAATVLLSVVCGSATSSEPSAERTALVLTGEADALSFSGTTCDDVGREFGSYLSEHSLRIIEGDERRDESKAVRLTNLKMEAIDALNKHLRDTRMVADCDAGTIMAAAEESFDPAFARRAGELLHDGPAVEYEEWRADTLHFLRVIDLDEHLDYEGRAVAESD